MANATKDETTGHFATPQDSITDSSVLQDAQSLWQELQNLSYSHLRLAALETRRAGEALVILIIAGLIVAVLLISAWLGLMAIVVLKLVEQGMAAGSALLVAVACNLLVALMLGGVMRYNSRFLQFPATLRSFKPKLSKPHHTRKS